MPTWMAAGMWGTITGVALVLGAAAGYLLPVRPRLSAGIMAFGAGALVSAVASELVVDAHDRGGVGATVGGFLAGAVAFTAVNRWLAGWGAKHRKRSTGQQPSEAEIGGSGLALAAGALLDGIPESIAIGVGLAEGGALGLAMIGAVIVSNVPEGLSSAAGMRGAGRSPRYVFGVWGGIAAASGVAAVVGATLVERLPGAAVGAIIAVAGGGVLAMLADTMIPEAFAETHDFTGLYTVLGFVAAFSLGTAA